MRKRFRYSLKRPEDIAGEAYLRSLQETEAKEIIRDVQGTGLQNTPELWSSKLRRDRARFAAIPKNVKEIRRILGIKDEHTVIVAPVYSGEWSRIHPDAIGIDFSEEALRRHPNERRILADLRNIPLPDGYADHIVMFEPTPMHPITASPSDVLRTLLEATRVAKRVHIIQRAKKRFLTWSDPFLTKYLSNLGVRYEVKDLTKHTELDPGAHHVSWGVAALTLKSENVKPVRDVIERDLAAVEKFMNMARRGKLYLAWQKLEKEASPALRKAMYHTYFAWRARYWTVPLKKKKRG